MTWRASPLRYNTYGLGRMALNTTPKIYVIILGFLAMWKRWMQVMSYDMYGKTPEEVAEEIENIFLRPVIWKTRWTMCRLPLYSFNR